MMLHGHGWWLHSNGMQPVRAGIDTLLCGHEAPMTVLEFVDFLKAAGGVLPLR